MFKTKIYRYDRLKETEGYRGTDYSAYIVQGEDLTEDITQVMDRYEITLAGLPTITAFEPETKFILDIVEYKAGYVESIVQTIHFVVSRDMVNQPILSDNKYFDHHISFIEPSVVAQKRLVDNISATYKLKDVSLEEQPAFPDTKATSDFSKREFIPAHNFGIDDTDVTESYKVSGKYFELEDAFKLVNESGTEYDTNYTDIENFKTSDGAYKARFLLPKLAIYYGVKETKTFQKIGYASVDYTISEYPLNSGTPTRKWDISVISNSNLGTSWMALPNIPYENIVNGEWLLERVENQFSRPHDCNYEYKKYTNKTAATPSYYSDFIDIQQDVRYEISFSLHTFPDNAPTKALAFDRWDKYTGSQPTYYQEYLFDVKVEPQEQVKNTNLYMTAQNTSGKTFFTTYSVDTKTIVYASSTPYSALALLQKAILNSGLYEKKDGVYIADVNKSTLPFYIDENYIDELSNTTVIENFYNQKNLWEIMLEVGNYIHAIPELKFGSNDRFMITFNRLGRTDEKVDNGTAISIFNSRSVEDYICATSSYIENMVQLGGYIEEWVAPKTTNELLLVSNDTGEILTSKPIIELLKVIVRKNSTGETADLTDYIYEENVYKTLSIDYGVVPNRGIALYYKLGTNIITGGDYQLPQKTTNAYSDYAIKKAIYSAFNGYPVYPSPPAVGNWNDLKINDYSFFVQYRTKDSVRQNHIRPDLRKYLLNTRWDRYPEHNQFNNQTDVVIDSVKFGNQVFGKLIRTGNNSYDIYEWHDSWATVKHKGELYSIFGTLYYVAKVTHTIYHSYIISKVSYSKDYNELSKIIGIPSEPRFYEISEQSLIWREFAINDLLLLTDEEVDIDYGSNYVFNFDHLADLIAGEGTDFAKYAITVFKGDKDANKYDQTVGQSDLYIEVINPINAYSSENTLTYEYDMADNYSAGDKVVETEQIDEAANKPNKGSYNSLAAVKYTDIYGRASLVDFYILGNIGAEDSTSPSGYVPPTPAETMAFPESPITTKDKTATNFVGNYDILATNVRKFDTDFNSRGIGLLKDCREAISVNYNLQMITSSDTFVLSPYLFLPQKSNLKMVLLAEEVNKLSNGYIDISKIITPLNKQGGTMNPYFDFTITKDNKKSSPFNSSKLLLKSFEIPLSSIFTDVSDQHFLKTPGYQKIRAIAIICDVSLSPEPPTPGEETINPTTPGKTKFVIARNIPELWTRDDALYSWIFGAPKKNVVFKNKQ